MRLFYAQSAEGKITITAPYRTFSSQSTFDELRGVQPYMYTKDGQRVNITNTQISNVNYDFKNNKHFEIEIIFAKEFNPAEGSLIYCKALFTSGHIQTFALPFVKEGVSTATASTASKTLSLSVSDRLSNPSTVYKTYGSSQYLDLTLTPSNAASFKVSELYKNYQSIEFVGGVFDNVNSKTLTDAFEANKGKFLESEEFVDSWKDSSIYFYIYSDNLSLDDFTKNGGGCLDALASNYDSNADYNNSSCAYNTRPPENIRIESTVGDKNELPTVTYIETKLSADDYDDAVNFDVTTYTSEGSADSTPTSKNLNVSDVYSELRIEWTDAAASLGFDSLDNIVSQWNAILSVEENTFDTTTRTFYPIIFRSSSAGCLDNSALNYDSTATESCPACCIYCDKTQQGLELSINSSETITVDSNGVLADTGGTILYENTEIQAYLESFNGVTYQNISDYLESLAASVWTASIYDYNQVTLPIDQFTQATIAGGEVVNLTNNGGNGAEVIFNYPGGGALVVGNEYYLEVKFDNGSGCTYYRYILFNVPFDGCLDPNATNYNPAPFNTGNGLCEYEEDDCSNSILFGVSEPLLQNNDVALFQIQIFGLSEDGVTLNTSLEGNFSISFNGDLIASDELVTGGNVFETILSVPQNVSGTIIVTNTITGCSAQQEISHPGIVEIYGCTDAGALNYDLNATVDDNSCVYCTDINFYATTTFATTSCDGLTEVSGGSVVFTIDNAPGNFTISLQGTTGQIVPESLQPMAVNETSTGAILSGGVYLATAEITVGAGFICTKQVTFGIGSQDADCGCTNPEAINYNPDATLDDFSCIIEGCTNPTALNYNPEATSNTGCVFDDQFPTPVCIPDTVDNMVDYEVTLNNIKRCLSKEGTTLLFKIKGGIKCDPLEQVKLTLISYLLNKIGLECLYNCNYSYLDTDEQIDCAANWALGGPSGGSLNFSYSTEYIKGDIVKWRDNYYVSPGGLPAGSTPNSFNSWSLCVDKTIVTGSETYLETFINFARKFCTVCFSDQPQATIEISEETGETVFNINLENGDNLEL